MKKILIIDDDVFLTNLYTNLLQAEGLEVSTANSGTEGLEQLLTFQPDMVVLDLHMPDINGVDVLRTMRGHAQLKEIPVFVFTNGYVRELTAQLGDLEVHKIFSKLQCKPRQLVVEIKELLASFEQSSQQTAPASETESTFEMASTFETVSALETAVENVNDQDSVQLTTWLERLQSDDRDEARRVCLLHIYKIAREEILYGMKAAASTLEGKLCRSLNKLLNDLYEHPGHVSGSTTESLEQALEKLRNLGEQARQRFPLESESALQDVLIDLNG